MASDLNDDIRYVKIVLLLVKGGTFSAKRLILKISTSDNKCIDDYLKSNQVKLYSAQKGKHISQKQIEILFPSSTTTTNLECWDISLLSYVLLNLFDKKLERHEKIAIDKLREKRNELQGHPASTVMSEGQFLGEWDDLRMVLYQLTKRLTTDEQDEINATISKIFKIQDFHFATNELKSFEGSDELAQTVVTEKLKCFEQRLNDCCRQVAELQASNIRVEKLQDIMARIVVTALTPATGDTAQAKLLNALQQIVSGGQHQAGEHNQSDGDEVLTASNYFVSHMEDNGVDILKVEKGSILIILRCSTISALKNITQYLANRMYKERLKELENALSKYLGSPVKLNISIVLETLYSALEKIEKYSNNKSIMLTLKCRGLEGVKHAIDCFGIGSSTNALNGLSEALTKYVGQKVELNTTIDVDKLEHDITELERQLILDDQNSEHELPKDLGQRVELRTTIDVDKLENDTKEPEQHFGEQNIIHELQRHMETSELSTTELLLDESGPTESSPRYNPGPTESSPRYNTGPTESSPRYNPGPTESSPRYKPGPTESSPRYKPGPTESSPRYNPGPTESSPQYKHIDVPMVAWTKPSSSYSPPSTPRTSLKGHQDQINRQQSFAVRQNLPTGLAFDTETCEEHDNSPALTERLVGIRSWLEGNNLSSECEAVDCITDMAYSVGTGDLKNGLVFVPASGRYFGTDTDVFQLSFVAKAAKQMKEKLHMERILIFQLNASHGISTQKATYDDKAILYISIHEKIPWGPYPEHGESHECGSSNAEGFNINIPLDIFAGDAEYLAAFSSIVMPIALEFDPELVLVSRGFDAPISPECFGHVISELLSLANGRVVLIAEVGYGLLSECKSADICLKCLLGKYITPIKEDQFNKLPSVDALQALEHTIQILHGYWPCLQNHLSTIANLQSETQEKENIRQNMNADKCNFRTGMETLNLSTTELLPNKTPPTKSSPRSEHIDVLVVASSHKGPQLSKDSHQDTLSRQRPFAVGHTTGLAFTTETCFRHPGHGFGLDAPSIRYIEYSLKRKGIYSEWKHVKGRRATLKELESCFPEDDKLSSATSKFDTHFRLPLIELPCGCFKDRRYGGCISAEALGAAGCLIDMAYMVGTGSLKNGLVLVPIPEDASLRNEIQIPLSYAAIAAKQMKEKSIMKKILIFEWNSSNGVNTQRATYDDKEILYISIHDKLPWLSFHEHGESHECGSQNAEGFNVNIQLNSFARDVDYLAAFRNIFMPIARDFNPEIVFVLREFDDEISFELGFDYMTRELMSLAFGKVVFIANGNRRYLERVAEIILKTFLGKDLTPIKEDQYRPRIHTLQALERTMNIQLKYWPCLQSHLSTIQSLLFEAQKEENIRQDMSAVRYNFHTALSINTETCPKHGVHHYYSEDLDRLRRWLERNKLIPDCELIGSRRATLQEIESYYFHSDVFHQRKPMKLSELPCGCFEDGTTQKRIPVGVLEAAGCVTEMAYRVGTGKHKNGLVLFEDSELYFEKDSDMFPLNFIEMAGEQLIEKLNMKRILIFQWNYSHRMSTQRAVYNDEAILYISLNSHKSVYPNQLPIAEEFNVEIVIGNLYNADNLAALRCIVMPIAREFNPEIVLAFVGVNDFEKFEYVGPITRDLMSLANGKVVIMLANVLPDCVWISKPTEMCLKALLGEDITQVKESYFSNRTLQYLERNIQNQIKYWPCLQKYLSEIQKLRADDITARMVLSALCALCEEDKMTWEHRRVSSLLEGKPEPSMVSSTDTRTTHDTSDEYDPIVKGLRLKMEGRTKLVSASDTLTTHDASDNDPIVKGPRLKMEHGT